MVAGGRDGRPSGAMAFPGFRDWVPEPFRAGETCTLPGDCANSSSN